MRKLHFYILRQILAPFVLFTVVLTLVVWMTQSLRLLDLVINRGQSGAIFAYLTLLMVPSMLVIILPIAFFGATRGDAALPVRKVYWRQISLLGTTMGSPADWAAMTAFVALHHLRPAVSDVFPLARAADAHRLMESSAHVGKIVLEISPLTR